MKQRRKLITENTIINIDEEVFKVKAQKLFWSQMVEYANEKYGFPVLELVVEKRNPLQHEKQKSDNEQQ